MLFVVDIQERLIPAMPESVVAAVIRNTQVLIETAARLGLPVIVSQQYPKGLGQTVGAIEHTLAGAKPILHRFDKTEFSGAATPELAALAPTLGRDQWIVTGMEAHVCVYQTARDLVARGYQVHVPSDAICSRTKTNWLTGRDLIARAGAIPTSTEVCVFDLLARAGTDDFKALSKLIK
ncbi:MAG: isochorismatase family protein [Deltaproteobacteria bacterium]|nr:isochorismatase family protein [Deltaproteobacteria bacterium]